MINYTTYRIDSKLNEELNSTFDFTSFCISDFFVLNLINLFINLFPVKTLQIQFYTLLENKRTANTPNSEYLQNGQDRQDIGGELSPLVEFVDSFVHSFASSFDSVLFSKDFKIYI